MPFNSPNEDYENDTWTPKMQLLLATAKTYVTCVHAHKILRAMCSRAKTAYRCVIRINAIVFNK